MTQKNYFFVDTFEINEKSKDNNLRQKNFLLQQQQQSQSLPISTFKPSPPPPLPPQQQQSPSNTNHFFTNSSSFSLFSPNSNNKIESFNELIDLSNNNIIFASTDNLKTSNKSPNLVINKNTNEILNDDKTNLNEKLAFNLNGESFLLASENYFENCLINEILLPDNLNRDYFELGEVDNNSNKTSKEDKLINSEEPEIEADSRFTPDSLESSFSTGSLNEFDNNFSESPNLKKCAEEDSILRTDNIQEGEEEEEDDLEADFEIETINKKIDDKQSLEQKEFEFNEKKIFEEESKEIKDNTTIAPVVAQTQSQKLTDPVSIIEKIQKLNQLREKITDINNKIKSVDMNSINTHNNNNNNNNNNTSNSNTNGTSKKLGANPNNYLTNNNQTDKKEMNKNYYCLHQDILSSFADEIEESNDGLAKNKPYDKRSDESDEGGNDEFSGPVIRYYVNPKYSDNDEDDDCVDDVHDDYQVKSNNQNLKNNQNLNEFYEDEYEESQNKHYLIKIKNGGLCKGSKSQDYRQMNNKTRLEVRQNLRGNPDELRNDENSDEDEVEEEEEEEEDDEDQEEDEEDDEDDDEELQFNNILVNGYFRQAQPMQKKYASTGFLFNRFGGYLAPIEESAEESLYIPNQSSHIINFTNSNTNKVSMKGSASCFNLDSGLNKRNNLIVNDEYTGYLTYFKFILLQSTM